MKETGPEASPPPFSSSFEEGTGLGAAIVYRIVQEHGGKIMLHSEPGTGTVVRIRLPRKQRLETVDEPIRQIAVGG